MEGVTIRELDTVVLTTDLPAYGLKRGDVGTIVLLHKSGGYEGFGDTALN